MVESEDQFGQFYLEIRKINSDELILFKHYYGHGNGLTYMLKRVESHQDGGRFISHWKGGYVGVEYQDRIRQCTFMDEVPTDPQEFEGEASCELSLLEEINI